MCLKYWSGFYFIPSGIVFLKWSSFFLTLSNFFRWSSFKMSLSKKCVLCISFCNVISLSVEKKCTSCSNINYDVLYIRIPLVFVNFRVNLDLSFYKRILKIFILDRFCLFVKVNNVWRFDCRVYSTSVRKWGTDYRPALEYTLHI